MQRSPREWHKKRAWTDVCHLQMVSSAEQWSQTVSFQLNFETGVFYFLVRRKRIFRLRSRGGQNQSKVKPSTGNRQESCQENRWEKNKQTQQSLTRTFTWRCVYFDGLGDRKRRSVGGNGCAASEEIENILDGDDVPLVEEVAQKQFWNRWE